MRENVRRRSPAPAEAPALSRASTVERTDEAGAHRLQVERRPCVMPSPACTDTALAGAGVGVAVATTIRSIDGASTCAAEGGARRLDGELDVVCPAPRCAARGCRCADDPLSDVSTFLASSALVRMCRAERPMPSTTERVTLTMRQTRARRAAALHAVDLVDQLVLHHVVADVDGGRTLPRRCRRGSMTMPLRPRKTLERRGRSSRAPERRARTGSRSAPSGRPAFALRRYWRTAWRCLPRFERVILANPSVTTTSAVPLPMSSPSTKPT